LLRPLPPLPVSCSLALSLSLSLSLSRCPALCPARSPSLRATARLFLGLSLSLFLSFSSGHHPDLICLSLSPSAGVFRFYFSSRHRDTPKERSARSPAQAASKIFEAAGDSASFRHHVPSFSQGSAQLSGTLMRYSAERTANAELWQFFKCRSPLRWIIEDCGEQLHSAFLPRLLLSLSLSLSLYLSLIHARTKPRRYTVPSLSRATIFSWRSQRANNAKFFLLFTYVDDYIKTNNNNKNFA
jgi:hypothetical protein